MMRTVALSCNVCVNRAGGVQGSRRGRRGRANGFALVRAWQSKQYPRTDRSREGFAMDIHKIEDSLGLSFQGQSPQQTQMMAMPEVGAPAANPLMMIWRRKGILLGVVAACVLGALIWYMFSTQIFRSEARLFVQTGVGKAPLDVV